MSRSLRRIVTLTAVLLLASNTLMVQVAFAAGNYAKCFRKDDSVCYQEYCEPISGCTRNGWSPGTCYDDPYYIEAWCWYTGPPECQGGIPIECPIEEQ